MIIGGVALSFIHPPWRIHIATFNFEIVMYLSFVILFGTMLAFWFYIESLQSLEPKETSLLGSLEPLAAVLTTVFWLKVPFGFFQWLILLLALVKKPVLKENSSNYDEKAFHN